MRKNLFKNLLENITLEYHLTLNPDLWKKDILKTDVRNKILEFANYFINYAKIDTLIVTDIIITGGNVNFNYTKYSDIDVHIVVDKSNIKDKDSFTELMDDKKNMWLNTYKDIEIEGYSVEPYVQDKDERIPDNQGSFSILRNKWLTKPKYLKGLDFNKNKHLEKKADSFEKKINFVLNNGTLEDVHNLKEEIKNMRNEGIKQHGEFSFENLLFKELRNRGLLDKINNYKTKLVTKELSLPKE